MLPQGHVGDHPGPQSDELLLSRAPSVLLLSILCQSRVFRERTLHARAMRGEGAERTSGERASATERGTQKFLPQPTGEFLVCGLTQEATPAPHATKSPSNDLAGSCDSSAVGGQPRDPACRTLAGTWIRSRAWGSPRGRRGRVSLVAPSPESRRACRSRARLAASHCQRGARCCVTPVARLGRGRKPCLSSFAGPPLLA